MPRPNAAKRSEHLPTPAQLAELQAALAETLSTVAVDAFPGEELAALAIECVKRGYTLVVSPQMDGRAVRISVPVGAKRLGGTAMNNEEVLAVCRGLLLAVRKMGQLP